MEQTNSFETGAGKSLHDLMEKKLKMSAETIKERARTEAEENLAKQKQAEENRLKEIENQQNDRKEVFTNFRSINETHEEQTIEFNQEKEEWITIESEIKNANKNYQQIQDEIQKSFTQGYKEARLNPEFADVLKENGIENLDSFIKFMEQDVKESDIGKSLVLQRERIDNVKSEIQSKFGSFKEKYKIKETSEENEEKNITKAFEILDNKIQQVQEKIEENKNKMVDVVYESINAETELNPNIKEEVNNLQNNIQGFIENFVAFQDTKRKGGEEHTIAKQNLEKAKISTTQIMERFNNDFGEEFIKRAIGKICDEQFDKSAYKDRNVGIKEKIRNLILAKIDFTNYSLKIEDLKKGENWTELLNREESNRNFNDLVNKVKNWKATEPGFFNEDTQVRFRIDNNRTDVDIYPSQYLQIFKEWQNLASIRDQLKSEKEILRTIEPQRKGFRKFYEFNGQKYTEDEFNSLKQNVQEKFDEFDNLETSPILKKYKEMQVMSEKFKDKEHILVEFVKNNQSWAKSLLKDENGNSIKEKYLGIDIFSPENNPFKLTEEESEKLQNFSTLNEQKEKSNRLFFDQLRAA